MLSTASITLILAAPALLVSASPFSRAVAAFPRDVTHIALDEENGQFLGYKRDGSFYGSNPTAETVEVRSLETRLAGSCAALSVDDAKSIPGWSQVINYARANWGKGSYKLVTNPDGYLDQPATACVSDDIIQVKMQGAPVCITQSASTDGKLVGTSGTVSLSLQEGYTSTATHTVTKSSSIGDSVTVSATFKIPEVVDVSTATTTTATFSSAVGNSFATTVDTRTTQTLTMNAPDGKQCHAEYAVKSCNSSGSGQVRYVAAGWVWFNFEDKTKGHYKWAANLDAILPDEDDRSSYMEFTSSMTGSSQSSYKGVCV